MKKYTIISILSFLVGIIAFAVAFYVFHQYKDFLALFGYYGIPEEIYASKAAITIFNFKIGIAKYTLLGIVAWIISIFFLVKRLKKV